LAGVMEGRTFVFTLREYVNLLVCAFFVCFYILSLWFRYVSQT